MASLLLLGACTKEAPSGGLEPALPGSLAVVIEGLPSGAAAQVTVTGSAGFNRTVTTTETLTNLSPGGYTVAAAAVDVDGDRYSVAPETQSVTVRSGSPASLARVTHTIATGRMEVSIVGLPAGAAAALTLTGPDATTRTVTQAGPVKGLPPGTYLVKAAPVIVDGDLFLAQPDSQLVLVTPGTAPTPVLATYALGSGRLDLTIAGVPPGGIPTVTITGPGGFSQTLNAGQMLKGLVPGGYTIAATPISLGGHTYTGTPAPAATTVVAGTTATTATVTYAISTGALSVTIDGLPSGSVAAVTVTGPSGFSQQLTGSQTLVGLAPGGYLIAASNVTAAGLTYVPAPSSQVASVAAGATPVGRSVNYALGTGTLSLVVSGLPGGTAAAVTMTGPNFSHSYTGSALVAGLIPGSYTVTAAAVSGGGQTYTPSPTSQTLTVVIGVTITASVTYVGSGGSLTITVGGLPGGANAAITVTGPGGFNQAVIATQTLTGLAAGTYTVSAASVSSGGTNYTAAPASQSVGVSVGVVSNATVTYSSVPATSFNLTIDGMYLTQATQKYDGSAPLVAGRDAYLRVFALANQANSATPSVRVRLYSGVTLVQTYTLVAPAGSTPTAVNEAALASSWNVLVPASLVQPNLKVLADVDPANAVLESTDADNQFPVSGSPQAVDVRALPTWNVRFVPVLQSANGLQGNVTGGNLAQFLADPLAMLPVAAYNADLRAVYTTTAPAVVSDNSNGAWGTVLSEILALKSADASARYYYGVLKTSYGSGVAGIGYVGGGANAALGWDNLPSGSGIMAHEVGHNMGRSHAPCGGASSPDPAFPYVGGKIGVYGLDVGALTLKSPATTFDLMGYCNPDWISDYTWSGIVSYRQSGPNNAPPVPAGTVAGLLVWGRAALQGGLLLEPAFRVAAPFTAPPAGLGSYQVRGLSSDGSVLFTYDFDASMTMTHLTGHEEHFAVVVPLTAVMDQRLDRIEVTGGGQTAVRTSSAQAVGGRRLFAHDPAPGLTRPAPSQVHLTWDAASYPIAMVRDATTGQVISFARGGSASLWTLGNRFDVTFSDGVAEQRRTGLTPR